MVMMVMVMMMMSRSSIGATCSTDSSTNHLSQSTSSKVCEYLYDGYDHDYDDYDDVYYDDYDDFYDDDDVDRPPLTINFIPGQQYF